LRIKIPLNPPFTKGEIGGGISRRGRWRRDL